MRYCHLDNAKGGIMKVPRESLKFKVPSEILCRLPPYVHVCAACRQRLKVAVR